MFARVVFHFVIELISRSTTSGAGRVAALDHEVGEDAMKDCAVVKVFAREKDEVVHRFRSVLGKKIAHDLSPRGLERGGVMLVGIDRHRRRRGISFWRHGINASRETKS